MPVSAAIPSRDRPPKPAEALANMQSKIWVDVEDLFAYASSGHRPSGIQRVAYELCNALAALPESKDRVSFVRHDAQQQCLTTIPWHTVDAIYEMMTSHQNARPAEPAFKPRRPLLRSIVKKAIRQLPPQLSTAAFLQAAALINLYQFFAAWFRRGSRRGRSKITTLPLAAIHYPPPAGPDFIEAARPGDVIAVFGAPWATPEYWSYIETTARRKQVRVALLIHDIIPLRRPEWCDLGTATAFETWFNRAICLADLVLAVSAATAQDVSNYARDKSLALRAAPAPIPIGTGFKKNKTKSGMLSARLPTPNSYALMVSTIEARKNHALLFAVWRRLLEDMPATKVPALVFAGRTGWLVSDLMQQLRNANFLDGKIVHIESPTDEELEALYDGCLFTLFPSFYEGFGLPIRESHAFGRPCITSNTTSLPEAGGALTHYIDPGNTAEAYRVIRETIENRAGLNEWRERVQREFQPVTWSESARAFMTAIDAPIQLRAIDRKNGSGRLFFQPGGA
jgi:glycosyltransferase involved in cell wall biosynthesis